MFSQSIGTTEFLSEVAQSSFPQTIDGEHFAGDQSFLSTLRALLIPRMKENDAIHLKFCETGYNAVTARDRPNELITAMFRSRYRHDSENFITVHNLRGTENDNVAVLNVVREKFTSSFPGFVRLEKITDFYRKSFAVDCYINAGIKCVILIVDRLDLKKLHYLQASILACLPWYFKPEDGVSDDEMALLNSLRGTSATKYIECLNKLAEKYDFRNTYIRNALKGFETGYERIQLENTRNDILAYDDQIMGLNQNIGNVMRNREEALIRLYGLEKKIAMNSENDSEIMEYFLCNKKLRLEYVDQSKMIFAVQDEIAYFDPEAAKRCISNNHSLVYTSRPRQAKFTSNDMKRLLTEIFVKENPRIKLATCAAYEFNLRGNVSPRSGYSFSTEFSNCIPNPHIQNYSCMGNYLQVINQMLQERDYIAAIEQCIASAKSLNWCDSTVMESFMGTMWRPDENCNCAILPDGSRVNLVEACEWLKSQEDDYNETEETENE